MASIETTVEGDKKLIAVLDSLTLNGAQKNELFSAIGFGLVENTQLRFAEGVSPDGIKWPVSLRARLQGGQTLIDTGVLRSSLTFDVVPDGVDVGTNLFYAQVHQTGKVIKAKSAKFLKFKVGGKFASKKQVTIPKREIVGVSDEDVQLVSDILGAFILRLAK